MRTLLLCSAVAMLALAAWMPEAQALSEAELLQKVTLAFLNSEQRANPFDLSGLQRLRQKEMNVLSDKADREYAAMQEKDRAENGGQELHYEAQHTEMLELGAQVKTAGARAALGQTVTAATLVSADANLDAGMEADTAEAAKEGADFDSDSDPDDHVVAHHSSEEDKDKDMEKADKDSESHSDDTPRFKEKKAFPGPDAEESSTAPHEEEHSRKPRAHHHQPMSSDHENMRFADAKSSRSKFIGKLFSGAKKLAGRMTGSDQKPKDQLVEDCTGCRFIWSQVEMDIGTGRYPEDVQASFEHNCLDAQKTSIFYKVCEDMYDDMYAMTDDYMSNDYKVDEMCQRAQICREVKSSDNRRKSVK